MQHGKEGTLTKGCCLACGRDKAREVSKPLFSMLSLAEVQVAPCTALCILILQELAVPLP